jgi:hypothetical protein
MQTVGLDYLSIAGHEALTFGYLVCGKKYVVDNDYEIFDRIAVDPRQYGGRKCTRGCNACVV